MPSFPKDCVLQRVTGNPGTGTVTLGAAVAGFQALGAGDDGRLYDFRVYDVDGGGNPSGNWEVQGLAPYTNSSTSFTRSAGNVIDGSSGPGVLVNFTSGTQRAMVVQPAETTTTFGRALALAEFA